MFLKTNSPSSQPHQNCCTVSHTSSSRLNIISANLSFTNLSKKTVSISTLQHYSHIYFQCVKLLVPLQYLLKDGLILSKRGLDRNQKILETVRAALFINSYLSVDSHVIFEMWCLDGKGKLLVTCYSPIVTTLATLLPLDA